MGVRSFRFWRIAVPGTIAVIVASLLGGPGGTAADALLSQGRPALA